MQFQVRDQALCSFSCLITNTFACCWMQLLWGKKTPNSIHPHLSLEYCVCYTKAGDWNERCPSPNFNFERMWPRSEPWAHSQRVVWRGSVLRTQSRSLARRYVLFRLIVPSPHPFSCLQSRSLVFIIGGLLIQMFTQNNLKSPQSLKSDISSHYHSPWNPPHDRWLWENTSSHTGLHSMPCLVVCYHVGFSKAKCSPKYYALGQQRKSHLFFDLCPMVRMKRALEVTIPVIRVK